MASLALLILSFCVLVLQPADARLLQQVHGCGRAVETAGPLIAAHMRLSMPH